MKKTKSKTRSTKEPKKKAKGAQSLPRIKPTSRPVQEAEAARRKELMGCFSGLEVNLVPLVETLVEQMVYLEGELGRLRSLPMLIINKDDPTQQRRTEAGALYTRLVTSYTGVVTHLTRLQRKVVTEVTEGESPLRAYLKELERDQ
jgi:hypothetical protein